MRTRIYYLLVTIGIYHVGANSTWGELPWVNNVNDCASFSVALDTHLAGVGDLMQIAASVQSDLEQVLEAACLPKFSECSFSICARAKKVNLIPEKQRKNPFLVWLNEPMSCEDFRKQMRERYALLGPYASLSEKKKSELRYVLDTSCSPRFKHCKFKSCMKQAARKSDQAESGSGDGKVKATLSAPTGSKSGEGTEVEKKVDSPSVLKVEDTVTVLARQKFKAIRQKFRQQQRAMIAKAIIEEKQLGADWSQRSNPLELNSLKPQTAGKFREPKRLTGR